MDKLFNSNDREEIIFYNCTFANILLQENDEKKFSCLGWVAMNSL